MNREQQPTLVPVRDRQAGEDLWQRYGAKRGVWSEPMLIALHERRVKGNKWFSLIDKVVSERTLGIAWHKVETNAGACGVDSMSVGHFSKDSQSRLLAVNKQLREGSYQPNAIRRVEIPKAGSKQTRPLGIPTVKDRVVQGAVRLAIEPIFEREFAQTSYGFRPGRGCKDALRQVEHHLREGRQHVVDVDIKGYFDNIPHGRLMELVRERISDGKVLGLIEAFLTQGVLEDGEMLTPKKGSPQGGLISPLLANIYLNPLDWLLQELGLHAVRYADDIVVMAESAVEAQEALKVIAEWMENAGLELHPEKTCVVEMNVPDTHFDFLGYRFMRSKRGNLVRAVSTKSQRKLREKLKRVTRRCNGKSMETIIAEANIKLRGWYGYFKQASLLQLGWTDGWMRMRLRSILRKRNKKRGRGRGRDNKRWPNRYFDELGLFSLKQAKVNEMSLRQGANC